MRDEFYRVPFCEDYVIVQRGRGGLVLVIIYLCLFIMEWGTKIFFTTPTTINSTNGPDLSHSWELRHWFGSYLRASLQTPPYNSKSG